MKNLFNCIYTFIAVLTLGLTACTKECDYIPAKQSVVETNDYRFDSTQPVSAALAVSDTTYSIKLERANADTEQTIEINSVADKSIFTIPGTVTFEEGVNEAVIEIAIDTAMVPFKDYKIELSISEDYINPYSEDNNSVCVVTLYKEDYAPYGIGTYNWGFLDLVYEQEIEYSKILNAYRFITPWVTPAPIYTAVGYGVENGQSVEFTINEENGTITLTNQSLLSGLYDPIYGSVTANFEKGEYQKDEENNEEHYLFQYKWTVAAGSFGSESDEFVLTDKF